MARNQGTTTTAPPFRFYPLGEAAVVVELGDTLNPGVLEWVQNLAWLIEQHPIAGIEETVPAFTTLTVYFHPLKAKVPGKATAYQSVCDYLETLLAQIKGGAPTLTGEAKRIPVCYGGVFGPDLEFVAGTNNLKPQEVIDLHTAGTYLVYMIGFAPGFPYLGGLDHRIATPRKPSPRAVIPAGSVGIGGEQTGVYPLETPGGWQLIGRTPLKLFCPEKKTPSFLKAGDSVRFYPVAEKDFNQWKEQEHGD